MYTSNILYMKYTHYKKQNLQLKECNKKHFQATIIWTTKNTTQRIWVNWYLLSEINIYMAESDETLVLNSPVWFQNLDEDLRFPKKGMFFYS